MSMQEDDSEARKHAEANADACEAERAAATAIAVTTSTPTATTSTTSTERKRKVAKKAPRSHAAADPAAALANDEKMAGIIGDLLPSDQHVALVKKKAESALGVVHREPLQTQERTSNRQPPSELEKAACTRPLPPPAQRTVNLTEVENRKARRAADTVAVLLRISELWDRGGVLCASRYFWPTYDASQHDQTLVKIDFIIDYLNNMLLIGGTPTTLERYKIVLDYSLTMTDKQIKIYSTLTDDATDSPINFNAVPHDTKHYKFDKNVFREFRETRTQLRREVRDLVNRTEDIAALAMRVPKRKRLADSIRDAATTGSGDGEDDDNDVNDHHHHDYSQSPTAGNDTETGNPDRMSAERISQLMATPAQLYRHMATTQYEREHPHGMTPLHQRLFIGLLNNLPLLHDSEQLCTYRLDDVAYKIFGLDKTNPASWSTKYIIAMARQMQAYVLQLLVRIKKKYAVELVYVYGEQNATALQNTLYIKRLARIRQQIEVLMRFLLAEAGACQRGFEPPVMDRPSILTMAVCAPALFDADLYASMSPYQLIVRRLLEECQKNGYRRREGSIYEEVMTEDGFGTNAFRFKCDIKDLAWKAPDMNFEITQWLETTAHGNINDYAAKYLTTVNAPEFFPDLKRQQFVWSFRNGVYDGQHDEFWFYDQTKDEDYKNKKKNSDPPWARVESSARYIDKDFDVKLMSAEAKANPSIIEVGPVKRIFEAQRLSADVQQWAWAFTGRLYFPQRMLDNWQVVFWIKGVAGTGKSTFSRAIKAAYEPTDIGVMQNNIEPQFGLEPFIGKFLLVAPDVKANFSLDSAVFQTMASADEMSITRKGLVARTVPEWTIPQLYLSNVYARWIDASGSIQRRVMALELKVPVGEDDKDTTLEQTLLTQIDALIVRACRSYRAKLKQVGTDDIWKHVPDEFKVARDEVTRQSADLVRFFEQFLVVSAGDTEEARRADFVELRDLEVLYRRDGAAVAVESGKVAFRQRVSEQIPSFNNTLSLELDKKLNMEVIHGCRLNLPQVCSYKNDLNWRPKASAFYDLDALSAVRNKEAEKKIAAAEKKKAALDAKQQQQQEEQEQQQPPHPTTIIIINNNNSKEVSAAEVK